MIDVGLMNQLGGNTFQTDTRYTGLNAVTATTAANHLYAGNKTSEAGLSSSDIFTTALIPQIVASAQGSLTFPIKPVVLKGIEIAGVLFLTAQQVRDLKQNFDVGEWGDIYRAALQGGQVTGNPLFTGAIGIDKSMVPELGN